MLSRIIPRADSTDIVAFRFPLAGGASEPTGEPAKQSADQPAASRIAALLQEIAALKRDAEQRIAAALRDGETRGRSQAEGVMKPVMDRLAKSMQELVAAKPRLRREVEEEAVRLALAIARRILRRELTVDPAALQALVQVVFERLGRQDIHRIVVHPEQLAQVRAAVAQITSRQIELVPDPSRESGTLILETARGVMDASIDSQLREIELGLADRLKW